MLVSPTLPSQPCVKIAQKNWLSMKWTIDAERPGRIPPKKNIIGKPIEYNSRNTYSAEGIEVQGTSTLGLSLDFSVVL